MEPNNEKLNNNNLKNNTSQIEEFIERSFEEVEDGGYDERGFYTTPNGSFWDENHTYFNHLGFDKHNGYYDEYGLYHPGYNYNYDLDCYDDEIDKQFINNFEQINKNNLNNLEEQYLINKECEKEIDYLYEENEENEENENDEFDDEEMERIYNECVSISKRKDPSLNNVINNKVINQNNSQENQENVKNNNEEIK